MAKITFAYNTPEKSIGGFIVDAFLSENYSFANDVTEVPVEEGVTISDNIVETPLEISIEGFIGSFEFVSSNSVNQNDDVNGSLTNKKERIKKAYQELLRIKKSKELLDLVTGLDTYNNMVITSFDIPRDVSTGADLHFTMKFKQVPIIRSETVPISVKNVPASSSSSQVQSVAKTGVESKKEVKEEDSLEKQIWKEGVKNGSYSNLEYEKRWGEPFIS